MKIAPKPSKIAPQTITNSSKIHPRSLPETLGDLSPLTSSSEEAKRRQKVPQEGPKGHQMDPKIIKNHEKVLSEGALRRDLKKERKIIDFVTP